MRTIMSAGPPKLDGIVFRIMPETAARIAAVDTGAVDLVWDLPPEVIDQFKGNTKVVIDSVPTSTWDGLIMNASQKPFDDVRVRRAVALAIDKKAMVELSLFGYGTPTHTMIPPSSPFFNDKIAIKTDIARSQEAPGGSRLSRRFLNDPLCPVGPPDPRTRRRWRG